MYFINKKVFFFLLSFWIGIVSVTYGLDFETIPQSHKVLFEVLEDSTDDFLIEDVLAGKHTFKPYPSHIANYGTEDMTLWLRIDFMKYEPVFSQHSEALFLYLKMFNISEVEFYYPISGGKGYDKIITGVKYPLSQKPLKYRGFAFPVEGLDHCYIRIHTYYGLKLPVLLANRNYLAADYKTFILINAIFFGFILFISCYNFFLWFSIKENIYGHYAILSLFGGVFALTVSGFSKEVLFPETFHFNVIFSVLSVTIGVLTHTFIIHFLKTKKYPILHWLQIILIICTIPTLFTGITAFTTTMGLFSSLLIFVTGIYIWYKGDRNAIYYLLAFSMYAVGLTAAVLGYNDILPRNIVTVNGILFGVGSQMLLFSFAVAARVNQYKRQVEQINNEHVTLFADQRDELEGKVARRTEALLLKSEEVSLQNEELHQQQEEIIAQRNYIEEKNRILEDRDNATAASLKTAKTIQMAVFPKAIFFKEYFADHFIFYKPKYIVAGDFYWGWSSGCVHIVISIDCTGHGIPGAFLSLLGTQLLNKIIKINHVYSPAQILEDLHQEFFTTLNQAAGVNNDNMNGSVVAIKKSSVDKEILLTFAGAKSNGFYENENGLLVTLKGVSRSIGGIKKNIRPFEEFQVTTRSQRMIYLFSNGFQNQNDFDRNKIGLLKLKKLLEANINEIGKVQESKLRRYLNTHTVGTIQRDDILVLGVRT